MPDVVTHCCFAGCQLCATCGVCHNNPFPKPGQFCPGCRRYTVGVHDLDDLWAKHRERLMQSLRANPPSEEMLREAEEFDRLMEERRKRFDD